MSSPYLPNTLGILQAIVALAQTASFTLTGGATSFTLVQGGGIKDLTDILPAMTVEGASDSSKRGGSGGTQVGWRVEEPLQFRLTLYADYTNSTNGEIDIVTMRDAVVALFQQCIKLGNIALGGQLAAPANVIDSHVLEHSGRYFFREITGTTYRGYMVTLEVTQQYSVTIAAG